MNVPMTEPQDVLAEALTTEELEALDAALTVVIAAHRDEVMSAFFDREARPAAFVAALRALDPPLTVVPLRDALVRTPETLDVERLRGERDHYLAGCVCPRRSWCVPHGWAGTDRMYHQVCADHDHVAATSPTPPEGLRAPYGGHPEFGPRVMANQAQPSIAGWESLAKDALLAFDQARAALATSPAPDPGAGLDVERLRRIEVAAREEMRTRDEARAIAGRHVEAGHPYTDPMPDLEAATVVATDAEEALRAALAPSAEPPETT